MDKLTKVLVITDDIRIKSGVAIQAHKICAGLVKTGKYTVSVMGGALQARSAQPVMVDGVKVYPVREYGTAQQLRDVFSTETPDIVLCFSDPRFFEYVFNMDNEIRSTARLLLYHTWDNEPFPDFNLPWYSACDALIMISKFSFQLFQKHGLECYWIPHGINEAEFRPLTTDERDKARKHLLAAAGIIAPIDFLVFFNSRNISRKRPGDILLAFDEFSKTHPRSALLMNTEAATMDGPDLRLVVERLCTSPNIILNFTKISTEELNKLYAISDVSINISHSEGHGLSVTESLSAGTPVIATATGGMTDQLQTPEGVAGILLTPAVRNLFGTPYAPYHYYDYVSHTDVVNALTEAYNQCTTTPNQWALKGEIGRRHILAEYNETKGVQMWDELLASVLQRPSKYQRFKKVQL